MATTTATRPDDPTPFVHRRRFLKVGATGGAAALPIGCQPAYGAQWEPAPTPRLRTPLCDSLEDIRNTQRIWRVIQAGRTVNRDGLLAWKVRDAAGPTRSGEARPR